MLKPKLSQQEQGFSLVEVLVAIVIATIFVTTALQAMVIAALFKAKAQEYSEATTWIQNDLEDLRYQASRYNDVARCDATGPNNGYADGFSDRLHTISQPNGTRTGDATSVPDSDTFSPTPPKKGRSGKTFTFTRVSTPRKDAPYAALTVTYDVTPTAGGSSVASLYTEVIPDGAFQCP